MRSTPPQKGEHLETVAPGVAARRQAYASAEPYHGPPQGLQSDSDEEPTPLAPELERAVEAASARLEAISAARARVRDARIPKDRAAAEAELSKLLEAHEVASKAERSIFFENRKAMRGA